MTIKESRIKTRVSRRGNFTAASRIIGVSLLLGFIGSSIEFWDNNHVGGLVAADHLDGECLVGRDDQAGASSTVAVAGNGCERVGAADAECILLRL